jgi:hypothetical protein
MYSWPRVSEAKVGQMGTLRSESSLDISQSLEVCQFRVGTMFQMVGRQFILVFLPQLQCWSGYVNYQLSIKKAKMVRCIKKSNGFLQAALGFIIVLE